MDSTLMAEQLRAWAEILEGHNEPHLLGLRAGLEEVANDLEEVPTLCVQGIGESEPCGLWDAEIGWIIDTASLMQAHDRQGNDIAFKDPEYERVWTLCWFRFKREDRCKHGMFFSGAGACPQCGGGVDYEEILQEEADRLTDCGDDNG